MLLSIALFVTAGAFRPVVTQQLESPTGVPTLQIGQLSEPLTGELSSAVQAWSSSQRSTFAVPAVSSLKFSHAFATRFGASFHLLQMVEGVEVYGAKLVVTLDSSARVVQTASSVSSFVFLRNQWALDERQALRKAAAGVIMPALRDDGSGLPYGGAKKVFFEVGEELHAGYLVNVATLDVSKNYYVAVDAVTGERLFVQNRVHRALDARVYPISPGGLDAGVGLTPTTNVQLRHADGGSMVAQTCDLFLSDGGWETVANPNGELCGNQMTQYNCCAREGCQPDAGSKRVSGSLNFGFPIKYSAAVCDRVRRAASVTNDAGPNYLYTPVDPPAVKTSVVLDDPSYSDEFAEVHSFYHVNRVYDWVRGLSANAQVVFAGQPAVRPFAMRDERRTPARKPAIWANVVLPNFQELEDNIDLQGCIASPSTCSTRADTLLALDNAAFLPRENLGQLPIPGFDTGVDTLMIFQGSAADAAYDSTVVQHEFGHGVVYATAELTFDSLALDNRGANNEGGAMHEGFADYIAAAFNDLPEIGPYMGPRVLAAAAATVPGLPQDDYLRSLTNTLACPGVLWGEVHQDSLHVSAALWSGRTLLRGSDNGATYDAAFYAMLVSIAPNADFGAMAAAMGARVKQAFPTNLSAEAQMAGVFQAKGVTGCSKVLEVTNSSAPRPLYQVSVSQQLNSALVPGPFQFKLRTPQGASKVRVSGRVPPPSPLMQAPRLTALVKVDGPITFTSAGNTISHDATQTAALTGSTALTASLNVAVPCGETSEIHVSIGAVGGGAPQQVTVTFEPLVNCMLPTLDGGTGSDGGTTGAGDGGTQVKTIPGVGADSTTSAAPAKTCGCSSAELAPMLGLALALLARRRRARQ